MRGANVFGGYWQAPEKTAASFVQDAAGRRWFRTGDLARQDPRTGAFTLLGRRHELSISGGFNIYPREVEEALGFTELAAIAVLLLFAELLPRVKKYLVQTAKSGEARQVDDGAAGVAAAGQEPPAPGAPPPPTAPGGTEGG